MSAPRTVPLPPALARLLGLLRDHGHAAHAVGAAVRKLLAGEPVADFEVATSAGGSALLDLFPRAVSLDAAGRRLLLPTASGPVELVSHDRGEDIDAELAHRDFTIHALAVDAGGELLDPFAGRADLAATRLRCVGGAAARIAEDPLRALRAARLVATLDVAPDAELSDALASAGPGLAALPASRIRPELHALLLGPRVRRGLELLRDCGLEARLAPEVAEDAARVVGALPADLELRLAAWLRGTRAVRILRRLREPPPCVLAVERLLHLHPIDASLGTAPEARILRLTRRSKTLLPGLLALREAEIAAGSAGEEVSRGLERVRRTLEAGPESAAPRLALDGRAVMELLGRGPGPEVGQALAHLRKAVLADPDCNTPEGLRERLLAWHSGGGRR